MKDEILALRGQGKSYNEIVAILGCAKSTIAYHCGEGQKEKNQARVRDRRSRFAKYTQEVKQSSGCVDCKERYPYWMLEFDHARGTKVADISKMKSTHSMEQIIEEIKKCDVVCANCHRIRTWSRLHSTGSSVMDLSEI
jgi:hypothetical protein